MHKEVKSKSNINISLHKLGLYYLKILPILIGLCITIFNIVSYFNINLLILDYIAGISILPILHIYISSYMYKFCEYHRIFLHYSLLVCGIQIYDFYYRIPVSNFNLLLLYIILAGIATFVTLYLYLKHVETIKKSSNKDN